MDENKVIRYFEANYPGVKNDGITKTATAFVNQLCEAGMTYSEAALVLEVCKVALNFTRLSV
jgi:hypothetical protein